MFLSFFFSLWNSFLGLSLDCSFNLFFLTTNEILWSIPLLRTSLPLIDDNIFNLNAYFMYAPELPKTKMYKLLVFLC